MKMMELANKELKQRIRAVGAFLSDASHLRLVGSVLITIDKEWATGRRYLTMEKE
jgi:transposase-like protein